MRRASELGRAGATKYFRGGWGAPAFSERGTRARARRAVYHDCFARRYSQLDGALLSPLDDVYLKCYRIVQELVAAAVGHQSKFSFCPQPKVSQAQSAQWAARRSSEDLRGRRILRDAQCTRAPLGGFRASERSVRAARAPATSRRARTRRGISDIGSDSAARSASPTAADDDIVF